MGLAGLKTVSILLLIVVVALAGGSPVFARDEVFILDPTAACPGEIVTISADISITGVGTSETTTNFDGGIVLSSDPDGLIGDYKCGFVPVSNDLDDEYPPLCVFLVSESASCGRYTITLEYEEISLILGSATFDVAGSCCAAVGGCVQPVNTFALLSPWLAVIGLVGCIATVVVVAKKRRP
jgi:hypothetical protein